MWWICTICGAVVALVDLHIAKHAADGEHPPTPTPEPEPTPGPASESKETS